MSDLVTNDFKKIVLENIPLIDVRAPIEFHKGAFKTSVNLPILDNEERHLVGTCYKEKGNEAATALGYKLVSGSIKKDRVNSWLSFIKSNPTAMIYCFRGGSRSSISQKWIKDANMDIIKLEGGCKAFRNYLIDSFTETIKDAKPIVLTGYTGSGKTILLSNLKNSIDLEGIANHRGSSFGKHPTPQPTQINFENNLAYSLIKHNENGFNHLIVEDEGKNIGKNFIPLPLISYFKKADLVFLETSLEDRIHNTLNEYVVSAQRDYIDIYGLELGLNAWFDYINESMNKVKRKLGGDKFNIVIELFKSAYREQLSTGKYYCHSSWIEVFLKDYYDPLYSFSLEKSNREVIFRGTFTEVSQYLKTLN